MERTSRIDNVESVSYVGHVLTLKSDKVVITTTGASSMGVAATAVIREGRPNSLSGLFEPDVIVGYRFDISVYVTGPPGEEMWRMEARDDA